MTQAKALDPFTVFGVDHTLDLDERALEKKYLRLSRDCHPDLHRAASGDCIAVLQRAAEINDAWRVLRDPWERARALLELRSPGVLDREKHLDPAFLAEALELAEEVATADDADVPALRARIENELAADFERVREELAAGDTAGAARRFHGAKYHRKALLDLDARGAPGVP